MEDQLHTPVAYPPPPSGKNAWVDPSTNVREEQAITGNRQVYEEGGGPYGMLHSPLHVLRVAM
jgi:hypothetical protein